MKKEIALTVLIGLNWLSKSGIRSTKAQEDHVAVVFARVKGIIVEIS
jgi:hypothetical protein